LEWREAPNGMAASMRPCPPPLRLCAMRLTTASPNRKSRPPPFTLSARGPNTSPLTPRAPQVQLRMRNDAALV
jgi:hypothetical protein